MSTDMLNSLTVSLIQEGHAVLSNSVSWNSWDSSNYLLSESKSTAALIEGTEFTDRMPPGLGKLGELGHSITLVHVEDGTITESNTPFFQKAVELSGEFPTDQQSFEDSATEHLAYLL